MSLVRVLAACGVAVGAAGCAIHPVPEDVTGVNTYDIVRQIRCETRETLRKEVIKVLKKYPHPFLESLASQYESHPETINTFHYNLFKAPELRRYREVTRLFFDAAIAYNFDLNMTEENNFTTDLDLLKPFSAARKLTIGFESQFDRKRQNHRIFTVTDTFSGLLRNVPEEYCAGHIAKANHVYPVAGRIGIDETVETFIKLTVFTGLGGKKDASQGPEKGPPTMTDTLTFTTTVKLSLTPTLEFSPVGRQLTTSKASLAGVADRTDIHEVAIGLAIAGVGVGDVVPFRQYLFTPGRAPVVGLTPGRGPVVGLRVTGGGTPAENLAVQAIDQVKSREIKIVPNP